MSEPLKVLLVDDEVIVGERLKPILVDAGCNVETFVDPKAALRRLDEATFDVVLADIRMEGINGLEILEHVRKQSPRTKVIMITGYAMMATAREAMEKGAFDFIAKPFKLGDLRATIARAAEALKAEG